MTRHHVHRIRTAVAGLVVGLGGLAAIESTVALTGATCDFLGGHTYRIAYEQAASVGLVNIYASASPDRIDSNAPIASTRSSPVTVSASSRARRVFFHLEPAWGPARVVATREIRLEGAQNFRDLGGYRTSDGRFVKWGRLYRSEHLTALTPRDYDDLAELGIRLVCDLRTPGERLKAPTRWRGQPPAFLLAGVLSDSDLAVATVPVPPDEFRRRLAAAATGVPPSDSGVAYDRFVIDYAQSYRQVIRRIVANDLPALTHCTGGRDRTGVYAAILLTMLGVPRETVEADYLLTDKYRLTAATLDRQAREWRETYGLSERPSPSVVRTLRGLRPETLRATFDAIAREYGSFDVFRRDVLQVSDAELDTIRSNLLEP